MRFVIDTNQVDDIARSDSARTFHPTRVITPQFGRVPFHSQSHWCHPALARYELAFGMGYPHSLDALAFWAKMKSGNSYRFILQIVP